MLCYVILNGEYLEELNIDKEAMTIIADGALKFCEKRLIRADKVVGDFDSYGAIPESADVYPVDKDWTDGEIALMEAEKFGADEVIFLCAGGLREDHFLGNLSLLQIASKKHIKAKAVTNYSEIYYVEDSISVNVEKHCYISIVALENSIIESSNGLKYEYKESKLDRASTLGISNVAKDNLVEIKLRKGAVYVFVNKEKHNQNWHNKKSLFSFKQRVYYIF